MIAKKETPNQSPKPRIFNYFTFGFITKEENVNGKIDVLIRKVVYRGKRYDESGHKISELQDRIPGGCALVIDIIRALSQILVEKLDQNLLNLHEELQIINAHYEAKVKTNPSRVDINYFLYQAENKIFESFDLDGAKIQAPEDLPAVVGKIFELSRLETFTREIYDETGLSVEKAILTPVATVCSDGHRKFSFLAEKFQGPTIFTGSPDSDIERSEWVPFLSLLETIWPGHRLFLNGCLRELNKKFLAEGKYALAKLVGAPIHS